MRFVLAIILSLTFAVAAVGCGGSACTDACEKLKSCAQGLNCAAGDFACGLIKSSYGNVDCSGGNSGDCTGAAKDAADKINSCSLDPATCACK